MVSRGDVEVALLLSVAFYEAAIEIGKWPWVLDRLRRLFGAAAAQIVVARSDDLGIIVNHHVGPRPEALRDWMSLDYSDGGDPRVVPALRYDNKPFYCRQVVSAAEFHRSRMYREVFSKHCLDETLGIRIPIEDKGMLQVLGLIRPTGAELWSDADVERLQLYVPHLRQATKVMAALDHRETLTRAFAQAFERTPVATLVLDAAGHPQFANPAATELLDRGDALALLKGSVTPVEGAAARAFRSLLAAVASGLEAGEDAALVIPRPGGGHSLYARLAPVTRKLESLTPALGEVAYAVVLLNDPARPSESDPERLQRLFALTGAEAEVMAAYAAGKSAPAIARASGRALETVRTHLKSIRDKTQTRTQAEIARLVANSLP